MAARTERNAVIPNGLVFRRGARFGDYANDVFAGIDWPDKDEEPDDECPIYMFTSDPYLIGDGLDLRVVQHKVVASVMTNYADLDLEPLLPRDYPVIDLFWEKHPRTIATLNCNGKFRRHKEAESGAYCFYCDGEDLDFSRDCLTNLLHREVTWPFPAESVLAQKTSYSPIKAESTSDLRHYLANVQSHLNRANALLQDQDVEAHSKAARKELKVKYDAQVAVIKQRAAEATEAYTQLKQIGLDKESLEARQFTLLARVGSIENGEAIARLKMEAAAIHAKIEALQGEKIDH